MHQLTIQHSEARSLTPKPRGQNGEIILAVPVEVGALPGLSELSL